MKCLHETVIWLLIPFLVFGKSYAAPTKKTIRNGKYMAFTAEDMFSDLLDDVQDPLAVAGTINEKGKFYSLNNTVETTMMRPKINDTKMTKLPVKTEDKFALYNQDTGKYELITTTSGHFSFPMKPVTENGVFFYGGEHYQYRRPVQQPNKSEEIKIFWSAVGDAVENSPYFPIQLNVPDMISAMTNFLVNYIPFLNRLTNPNHPRLPYQVFGRNHTEQQQQEDHRQEPQQVLQYHPHHPLDYYDSFDVYQPPENTINRREYVAEDKSREKPKVKRKSNKKKNSHKSATKGIFSRLSLRRTTSPPVEDTKLWSQFGSDTKETYRLKNMPITRKRVRVADKEIFNFRNSDISNSPIMILNVPQRPIMHYKVLHNEVREKLDKGQKNQTETLEAQQQQQEPQLPQQLQLPQIPPQLQMPQQQIAQQLLSQRIRNPVKTQKQQKIRNPSPQTPVKPQKQQQVQKPSSKTPRKSQQQQQQIPNRLPQAARKSQPTQSLLPQTPGKSQQQQQIQNRLPQAARKSQPTQSSLPQTPGKSRRQTEGKSADKQTKQNKQNRRKTRTNSKTKSSSRRTGRSDSEVNEQTTGSKS